MLALIAIVLSQTCSGEFVCRSGDQAAGGYKTWTDLAQFPDSYSVGGVGVGVYAQNGIATRYLVAPVDGQGIVVRGRRGAGDPAANLIVESSTWRGGAYQFSVNAPACVQTFGVTESGDVNFGQGVTSTCGSDVSAGSLVDTSGGSGHIALKRSPGYYLALRGALGARDDAVNSDGSHPSCTNNPWAHQSTNGCVYNYAGGHGDIDLGTGYALRGGGFIAELYNGVSGVGARTDHRAYWDWNGAYSQNHGLTRAQFPSATQVEVMTNLGSFFYEAAPGAQYWANDTKHWYHAEGDAGWVQFAEQPSVDVLLARIAALEARVSALEAQ